MSAAENVLSVGLLSDWPGGNVPVHGEDEKHGRLVRPLHHAGQHGLSSQACNSQIVNGGCVVSGILVKLVVCQATLLLDRSGMSCPGVG